MMSAERGAAENTLSSYRRDLEDASQRDRWRACRRRRRRHPRLSRRHRRARLRADLAGAQTVGDPPVLQVPLCRGPARRRPDRHAGQPEKGPAAAQDDERGRDRPAARPRRARGRRRRARRRRQAGGTAPACAGRGALRHRPARFRAGRPAGDGGAARRPFLHGARQGRQGAHGAAVGQGARGDARLARRPGRACRPSPTARSCFRPLPTAAISRARSLPAT